MSNAPICTECEEQMIERVRRSDGTKFYGCPNYPRCTETSDHEDTDSSSFGDYFNGQQDD